MDLMQESRSWVARSWVARSTVLSLGRVQRLLGEGTL